MTISQCIARQMQDSLPFVIYRKPFSAEVLCFTQEDQHAHHPKGHNDQGFVFAPFHTADPAIIIPGEVPIELEMDLKPSPSTDFSPPIDAQEREQYIGRIEKAIATIETSELQKVVLSRKQALPYTKSQSQIMHDLLTVYPSAFVYCWYHPKTGMWMGATPERLLSLRYNTLKTMSLAGTQPYIDTTTVSWGEKEQEEQQLVTDSIIADLQPFAKKIELGPRETHKAGALLHLKTEITAEVAALHTSLLEMVAALHPTPAVCGMPRDKAKIFIDTYESYDRRFYTGYLGELQLPKRRMRAPHRKNVENLAYTAQGLQSHLFVNLRCMEIKDNQAIVYVGGGITAASNAQEEWIETVHKLKTMGRVLS